VYIQGRRLLWVLISIHLQLIMAVSAWLKLLLDIAWAWISLSIMRFIYNPSGRYWVSVNQVMQVSHTLVCECRTSFTCIIGPLRSRHNFGSREAVLTVRCHQLSPESPGRSTRGKHSGTKSVGSPFKCSTCFQQEAALHQTRS